MLTGVLVVPGCGGVVFASGKRGTGCIQGRLWRGMCPGQWTYSAIGNCSVMRVAIGDFS